ncbi:MAG: capsid protein [Squirrel astrovirus 2]|nr:MAG: capsid protein [Squirrel astrovirus 2]
MANGQTQKQKPKAKPVKVQVAVTQGPANQGKKPRQRKQRWSGARKRGLRQAAQSAARKEIHRLGLQGPKVSVTQTVTATLGTVGANQGDKVELEMASILNPALVKEQSGSNAFGPIQALAAQFSLWRVVSARLRFTPLVGSSAVSGTAIRASLNLTSTPSSTSWSGLGARIHQDVNVGRTGQFTLTRKMLAGPRETWWLTNTNEDKTQSLGPTIEVHSFGKTVSTYQNTPFAGSLFLVELRATWQFANFTAQPSLATLAKEVAQPQTVKIDAAQAGQAITMTVTDASLFSTLDRVAPAPRATAGAGTVGETILQVVDASVNVASGILPPPFGWLLAGGWWFVKRITGNAADGVQFQVYASAEDAANNRPCIATGSSAEHTLNGTVQFNQINAPNTGQTSSPQIVFSRSSADPPQPGSTFNLDASVGQPLIGSQSVQQFINPLVRFGSSLETAGNGYCCFQIGLDANYRHVLAQAWPVYSPVAIQNTILGPLPTPADTIKLIWDGVVTGAKPVAYASWKVIADGATQPYDPNDVASVVYILWQGFTSANQVNHRSLNAICLTDSIVGSGTSAKVKLQPISSTGLVRLYAAQQATYLLTMSYGSASEGEERYQIFQDGSHTIYAPSVKIPDNQFSNLRRGPLHFGLPYRLSLEMHAIKQQAFTYIPPGSGTVGRLPLSPQTVLEEPSFEGQVTVNTDSDSDCDDYPLGASGWSTPVDDSSEDSDPEDEVDWAFSMAAKFSTGEDDQAPLRRRLERMLIEEGVPSPAAQRRAMLAAPSPAFQSFLRAHQEVLADGRGRRSVIVSDLSTDAEELGLQILANRGHAE